MDLTPFVDTLRRELAVAAEAGGEQARELAERLVAPLDAATRLMLLTALSAAAEEITRELAPGSVDVRLRGRDADFVVTQAVEAPPAAPAPPPPPPVEPAGDDDGAMVRINLRLAEHLKTRVEDAAAKAGLSTNAWLVRAATTALTEGGRTQARDTAWGGQRYTGWVR